MRALIAIAALLCVGAPATAANLYVNNSGSPACSDATSKASNSAASPWCSIGRAVWGNASRSSPSSSEAATAGDTVFVTGGTYDYSGTVNDRLDPVYNPVNQGTAGNFLTITASGTVVLTGTAARAPAIGSNGQDYVKWYANIALGHSWTITACGWEPTGGDNCSAGQWAARADTGPVVCTNAAVGLWVEGTRLTGVPPLYVDNWDGIDFRGCDAATIRNNYLTNWTGPSNSNSGCFKMYGTTNSTFENNTCITAGVGFGFKDTGADTSSSNIVRYNWIDDADFYCLSYSMTLQPKSDHYQNVCINSGSLIRVTGGAITDYIYNNTAYNILTAGVQLGSGSGARAWNNIIHTAPIVNYIEGATWPAASSFSFEHNNYYNATSHFYTGSDGNRTFASYLATFTDQDQTSPVSVVSDPLFANAAGNDFRLCTAAGVPHANCSGASPSIGLGVNPNTAAGTNAGAYITGNECIGLESGCTAVATAPIRIRVTPIELFGGM